MTNLPRIEENTDGDGTATCTFQIPGIGFELRMREKERGTCIVRGIKHPVIKSNFMEQYTKLRTQQLFRSLSANQRAKLLERAEAMKKQMIEDGYEA